MLPSTSSPMSNSFVGDSSMTRDNLHLSLLHAYNGIDIVRWISFPSVQGWGWWSTLGCNVNMFINGAHLISLLNQAQFVQEEYHFYPPMTGLVLVLVLVEYKAGSKAHNARGSAAQLSCATSWLLNESSEPASATKAGRSFHSMMVPLVKENLISSVLAAWSLNLCWCLCQVLPLLSINSRSTGVTTTKPRFELIFSRLLRRCSDWFIDIWDFHEASPPREPKGYLKLSDDVLRDIDDPILCLHIHISIYIYGSLLEKT